MKEALILHIETASSVCSTALSRGQDLIDIRETVDPRSHASRLSPFVDDLMKSNDISFSALDAVSISLGPGSYTGLRIGVSTAKGIAYGADLPIIGVSGLQALANGFIKDFKGDLESGDLLCPMLDARRMEVYSAFFDTDLKIRREVKADIIDEGSYHEFLSQGRVFFFGEGSDKCRDLITHPNSVFIDGIAPSARYMIDLAEEAYHRSDFVDVAYFEPFYLKDFIATIPRNKVIPPRPGTDKS